MKTYEKPAKRPAEKKAPAVRKPRLQLPRLPETKNALNGVMRTLQLNCEVFYNVKPLLVCNPSMSNPSLYPSVN